MHRRPRHLPVLALAVLAGALAFPGCDARGGGATASDAPAGAGAHGTPDGHPDGIRGLAGGSYFGVVKVRVVPPDGSGIRATTRNGRASASLEPSGRLVVSGDVDRESDAGFAAEGRFSSGGWEGGSGAVELRIGPDGSIAGGGIADDGNRMEIEGRVNHRRLDLLFEIELLGVTAGGFPPGTRFQFRYDLWRPFERPPGQAGATPDGGCREVVYRSKLVPNLSGGAMGMVQVPECRR